MRLYKLEELFEHYREVYPNKNFIHVCTKCKYRTPSISELKVNQQQLSVDSPQTYEINEQYCDKCNQIFWERIQNEMLPGE